MIAARQKTHRVRRRVQRVGRAPLDRASREFVVLLLGHLVVFGLSLSHDEIVSELVAKGYVRAGLAERFELLIGLVLFLCWGALSVRMARLMADTRAERADDVE